VILIAVNDSALQYHNMEEYESELQVFTYWWKKAA